MALVQDSTGLFLDSSTGQYFSPYTAPKPIPQQGYMSMSGFVPYGSSQSTGMMGMGLDSYKAPEGLISSGGQSFVPFTGSQEGISTGKRSVVDAMMANRQPFQYNTPSLADLFPMMQGNMQAPMQNGMDMQPSAGAGRFMGGLLGAMPTPESSVTTPAPSSGAGRFL